MMKRRIVRWNKRFVEAWFGNYDAFVDFKDSNILSPLGITFINKLEQNAINTARAPNLTDLFCCFCKYICCLLY